MSTILDKVNEILAEKTNKIIPNNIKNEVQIFDIIGNYTGSGGVQDIYKVSSIQERDAIEANENDICLVYSSSIKSINENTVFNSFHIKNSVTLPSSVSGQFIQVQFKPDEETQEYFDMRFSCDEWNGARIDIYGSGDNARISYSSSDFITFTLDEASGDYIDENNNVNIPVNMVFGSPYEDDMPATYNPVVGYFIETEQPNLIGIYIFTNNQWKYLSIGKYAEADKLFDGNSCYTDKGSIEGKFWAMGNEGNSINTLNTLFSNIRNYVNNATNLSGLYKDFTLNNIANHPLNNYFNILDCHNLTDISGMFANCRNITNTYYSDIDTTNVTNMFGLFENCQNLTSLPNINSSKTTDIGSMFKWCRKLTSIPALDTSNVINASNFLYMCSNITSVPNFNTTNIQDASFMYASTRITTIGNIDTSNMVNMANMFENCPNLITVPNFNTINAVNISRLFSSSPRLTEIPNIDTSNVIDMSEAFTSVRTVTTVPNFNTSKVITMRNTFERMLNLTTVPNFDTSNVTNMQGMFYGSNNLTTVPNFNTSKVTGMIGMFGGCSNLTGIPNFDTSNVIGMSSMFYVCENLVDVPELNTSKVNDMYEMFYADTKLSNASLSNILNMCINAVNVTNKTIKYLGITNTSIQNNIMNRPEYQDFLNAGWTLQ